MWSFFSRDPTKDFAYEVGELVPGLEEQSIWTLHKGKKKQTGDPVSIFSFDVKNSSESQVQLAKTSFKKIKTLRHPNILTFLDGIESDKVIYIATEEVVPLDTYLRENQAHGSQNELAISWGLHQVAKGLSFLINDCNLIHNNVCMASIFVDKAGEWKLGGVDYMYPAQGPESIPPVKILPTLERYDPPEKNDIRGRCKEAEKWSSDMWGLGCLIWEVFNGALPRTSSLKSLGKIPKPLVPNYCELVGANPRSRPNPSKFIQNCRASNGFMNNKFVDTMMFLEEIQIKDQHEKTSFFGSLAPNLDTFPRAFCKNKILPQLLIAFEYGEAGSAVLAPLFKLGKLLDETEYQQKIVPCVVKLFSSTDRSTRVKLLQQLEVIGEHLLPPTVNDQIFPKVVQGFMDTNPVVREQTIKAMLYLAPKLNYKNLNEELMKHFARLQAKDDQGGIRTNTTVCLGKIGGYLNPQIRQKVLMSAFLRSLKDPFPPSRQAGILAMTACNNYFSLQDSANRLLPAICACSVDTEKIVRDQAFKAIKCFLEKLEKVSENPELITEIEKDVMSGGTPNTSSWAGWAVSGIGSLGTLTSKLYKGKGQQPAPAKTGHDSASVAATPSSEPSQPSRATPERTPPPPPAAAAAAAGAMKLGGKTTDRTANSQADDGWGEDNWGSIEETEPPSSAPGDGWDDDDWGSLEDTGMTQNTTHQSSSAYTQHSTSSAKPSDSWGDDWGQDDFSPIEDASLQPASSYNWDAPQDKPDDFFSEILPTTKSQQKSKSLQQRSAEPSSSFAHQRTAVSSGWEADDSWGAESGWDQGDDWQAMEDAGVSKAELAKKKREEKKLQRQKEMQEKKAARAAGGGAMKLGARKLNKD